MADVLLVAGPAALQPVADARPLLAGTGMAAAIASAGMVPTQLWSRCGEAFDQDLLALIGRRRIDIAGLDPTGPSASWDAETGFVANGSILPEAEPVSAEGVGGALLVDLPANELSRAHACLDALDGTLSRVVACTRPTTSDELEGAADGAEILVTPYRRAAAALGTDDPEALVTILQNAGAVSVALTNGPFGGLIAYKAKRTTWPALPKARDNAGCACAIFAGILAANLVSAGHIDLRSLKRSLAVASGATATALVGPGTKAIMQLHREQYLEGFNRLRRATKA